MLQREEGRDVPWPRPGANMHAAFERPRLGFVNRHGVPERQDMRRLLVRQRNFFSTLR